MLAVVAAAACEAAVGLALIPALRRRGGRVSLDALAIILGLLALFAAVFL